MPKVAENLSTWKFSHASHLEEGGGQPYIFVSDISVTLYVVQQGNPAAFVRKQRWGFLAGWKMYKNPSWLKKERNAVHRRKKKTPMESGTENEWNFWISQLMFFRMWLKSDITFRVPEAVLSDIHTWLAQDLCCMEKGAMFRFHCLLQNGQSLSSLVPRVLPCCSASLGAFWSFWAFVAAISKYPI